MDAHPVAGIFTVSCHASIRPVVLTVRLRYSQHDEHSRNGAGQRVRLSKRGSTGIKMLQVLSCRMEVMKMHKSEAKSEDLIYMKPVAKK